MRKSCLVLFVFLFSALVSQAQNISEGSLYARNKKGAELGACPLKHTLVKTDISGFTARVAVTQQFENNFTEPVEAVYTFPLSQNSAVDRMTMQIGERTIRGRVLRREEARKVYEDARTEGKTASLLDQQRPNIFTQSVANIMPGEKITIEISYVETLKYEDGSYEFVFPMTIAPRYNPSSVTDASAVSPIVSTRAGHDISIEVNLEAGVPVEEIRSFSHEIETLNLNSNNAKITLKNQQTIPNKDFVLHYDVTGKRIEDALLAHKDARGGFFTLILQPPDQFAVEDVTPKEIVFVLDTSGSMSGFPLEKAKEAMKLSLAGLYPHDHFNLITFAGNTSVLFEKPVPATQANLEKALAVIDERASGGGTEMMAAIRAALAPSGSAQHVRVVCFMTDGLVGNEDEIIAEVKKNPQARVFSFGIGESVNRYLLDKIAQEGRGEAEYVGLKDDGSRAARKFYERVRTPLLTDISVDWNGLPVADVYPQKIGDLFSAKPVVLSGRYAKGASGAVRLKGKIGGQEYVREIPVELPDAETDRDELASLWARAKIDDLIGKSRRYASDDDEEYLELKAQTKNQIIALGLKYNLLTQFTSFVAVEERIKTVGGKTRKVEVPVQQPEGMKNQSEDDAPFGKLEIIASLQRPPRVPLPAKVNPSIRLSGRGYGVGSGSGNGMGPSPTRVPKVISGGVVNGKALMLTKPPYPAAARAVRAAGAVNVQVTIDEAGSVISATAVSGHPLLRAAAEQAARNSKFAPTSTNGQPIKVAGVIVYNFVNPDEPGNVNVAVGNLNDEQKQALSPEQQAEQERLEKEKLAEQERLEKEAKARQAIAEKLHFWVFALFERLQKGEPRQTENESKFVREGVASLEIHLTAKTPAALAKLKTLGFEILTERQATIVIGKLPIGKLADLARIEEIQYVLPQVK